MASYEYDDYRVTLTARADGAYDASAVGADGVVHTGELRLPFDDAELEREVLGVAAIVTRSAPRPAAIATRDIGGDGPPEFDPAELGGALAEALLAGDVATGYDGAFRRATAAGRGLRLTLSLGAAPRLLSVPWELLYRRPTFLANQRKTPLVRHLDVTGLPQAPAIQGTVQVLGVIASPSDCPPLDVAAERERVERAMATVVALGRVELTWLDSATPRRLREVLRDGNFHVLHYVGHGDFTAQGEGVLFLDGVDGGHTELDSDEMASLLGDQSSLRLVVLNSCDGARTTLTDPYAGVATTLVQLGVPAVVAMQFEISDAAAILFAEELYTNLIGRQAPIDAAVSEARKAIYIEQKTAEWATPVLFMGDVSAELFHFEIAAAPLPPPPPPGPPVQPVVGPSPTPPAAPPARRVADDVVTTTTRGVGRVIKLVAFVVLGLVVLLFGIAIVAGLIEGITSDDDDASSAATEPAGSTGATGGVGGPGTVPAAPPVEAADAVALTGPLPIDGSIDVAGGTASFPIDLAADQNVYISSESPCGPDIRYELDDPTGALVSDYARSVCDDIGPYTATTNGTHTLLVTGVGAATGDFSFVVTPVRPDRTADLAVGDTAVGNIDEPGAYDWYSLDLAAGDILYLDGRGACGADLRYELYSPSAELLLGYDRPVCQDGGRVVVTENGFHQLMVYGIERATGEYGILVAPVRADRDEVLVAGQTASGTIDVGAEDVFTIDLAIGDQVSIAPHTACGADLRYAVESPSSAKPLGYDFRTCDPGTFTVTEAGPHTLRVYGVETATGPYALTVTAGG